MEFLKTHEVLRLFDGISCPHCKEPLQIYEPGRDDLNEDFREFIATSDDATEECLRFNNTLNEKLQALAQKNITEEEFNKWARDYKL